MQGAFTIEQGWIADDIRFVLRTSDGDVVFTSLPFPSEEACRDGIRAFRQMVANAPIEGPTSTGPQPGSVGSDEASTS